MIDEELLSTFIKQCKKITSNFTNDDITRIHTLLQVKLNNTPTTDLFYHDILFALYITSNYIQFESSLNIDQSTVTNYSKQKYKLPQGWSIIK